MVYTGNVHRQLVIVHSSDLHVGDGLGRGVTPLDRVIRTAEAVPADILLLVGDTFDHHRLPPDVVEAAAHALSSTPLRVVILPGNHDCLTRKSVFDQYLTELGNLAVLGLDGNETVRFPDLDLEVWGRAHRDYANMHPLSGVPPRSMPNRVVTAHGHWVRRPEDRHRSWLIHDREIESLDGDYLALGHWPLSQKVGGDRVPAYYSGSPDLSGTVNVVMMGTGRPVKVSHESLR